MYLASEIGRIAVVDMMIIDQGLDQLVTQDMQIY